MRIRTIKPYYNHIITIIYTQTISVLIIEIIDITVTDNIRNNNVYSFLTSKN